MTLTERRLSALPSAPANRLDCYRPGRNYVRLGDVVHVKPSKPGRRDGYEGHVVAIRGVDTEHVVGVDVVDPRSGSVRTLTTDRIERRAQSKVEVRS